MFIVPLLLMLATAIEPLAESIVIPLFTPVFCMSPLVTNAPLLVAASASTVTAALELIELVLTPPVPLRTCTEPVPLLLSIFPAMAIPLAELVPTYTFPFEVIAPTDMALPLPGLMVILPFVELIL
jgi:hypothetical protein